MSKQHAKRHVAFPPIDAWRQLPKVESSQGLAQRLMPTYMAEIAFSVEAQLQSLDKRFHNVDEFVTSEENSQYFDSRHKIFFHALQSFGETFSTHRLFLKAISDEHQRYVRYLHRCLDNEKDTSARLRNLVQSNERCVLTADKQRQELIAQYEAKLADLTKRMDETRTQQLETAVRDRAAAPDLKRQIQELELQRQLHLDEISTLQLEKANLLRLNEALLVDTFSDSLQSTRLELNTLKEVNSNREEQILELNDAVEDLSRDLRRLAQSFSSCIGRQLSSADIRFTRRGHVVLFGDDD